MGLWPFQYGMSGPKSRGKEGVECVLKDFSFTREESEFTMTILKKKPVMVPQMCIYFFLGKGERIQQW